MSPMSGVHRPAEAGGLDVSHTGFAFTIFNMDERTLQFCRQQSRIPSQSHIYKTHRPFDQPTPETLAANHLAPLTKDNLLLKKPNCARLKPILLPRLHQNPYNQSAGTCGSSSGSAISVAANMAAVSLGTETDGSILCPSSFNSVVGIKPTVGLTSRAGVIPISPRQDTIGPICRTVTDAVYVLDAIVGFDCNDAEATREASKYIPFGGYKQFLKANGLKGKRLGIVREPFFTSIDDPVQTQAFEHHLHTLRQGGAIVVDHLQISNINDIFSSSSEQEALQIEFKISLNAYLEELVASPVRSLADVIAFNEKFSKLEMIKEYGQDIMLKAQATNGIGDTEKKALLYLARLSKEGFEKMMGENELDALVTPGPYIDRVLAIGGFPGISVPAGYGSNGVPFGICFGGLKGSEPKLIEIAFGFEQATKVRKPPSFDLESLIQPSLDMYHLY